MSDPAGGVMLAPSSKLLRAKRWLGRYWIVLQTLCILVVISTILRAVLFVTQVDKSHLKFGQVLLVMATGLRFDLLVGLVAVLPQALHMTFNTNAHVTKRSSRWSIHTGLVVTFGAIVLLSCSEYLFFDEFESRLNYIAFEYLIYPTEVLGNIWESYPVGPLLGGVVVLALLLYWPMRKGITPLLHVELPFRRRLAILGVMLAAIAGLWMTTGMASTQLTRNRVANEVSGNGLYSFVYYAWTNRFDYDDFYRTIPIDEAYRRVTRRMGIAAPKPGMAQPMQRTVRSEEPVKNYNVVLILEESLGSDFIGALGDERHLTPRFDELTKRGLLLDNFFATGNRTARALEATLTGLPPIPTESILKRDHSDRVTTLARTLADRGYRRLFVYGGRGLFDGMRSFMMANGFERFIEQSDYPSPTFVSPWGVADEDIFSRAVTEFDALQAEGKPFFSVVLTVSNHKPFTYPDGRIKKPSSQQQRNNAVQYADFALGQFFDRAEGHSFYKNTLFVVMGDHGARVYGAQLFPIKSYRVPVLIIEPGGANQNTRNSTLASSMDIAPTILGILGGGYDSVFFGRDMLHIDPRTGYALLQHNHDLALLTADDHMALLGCPKTLSSSRLDRKTFSLLPDKTPNADLTADAISFYQAANRLYYDENYFPLAAKPSAVAGTK
jgi:phosphoglycerol transferase MdoB-like AlkP superfamily enzyme